jgi:PAS domain-containing protein
MLQLAVPDDRLHEFADFFENAPIGVLVLDPDGAVQYANRAQHEITPRDGIIGAHVGDLVADEAAAASVIAAGERGQRVQNLRVQVFGDGGGTLPVVLNTSAWQDPDSVRREIYCFMFRDDGSVPVTPLPTAGEAAPDSSPDELAMLVRGFENAPVGLHIVGGDGLIKWANHHEVETLGYLDDPSAYIGHHIAEFHADQAVIDDMLDRLVSGRPLTHYRATLLTKGGEHLPVVIYSSPRFDGDNFVNTRCYTFVASGLERETRSFSWPRNEGDSASSSAGELTTVLQRLAGRRQAEESLGLLAEAGRVLADSRGLAAFCELVVPHLADRCVVERTTPDGTRQVNSEGSPGQGEAPEYALRAPFRSGRVEGALVLERRGTRERFGAADVALAEELARRVGTALELAELRILNAAETGRER